MERDYEDLENALEEFVDFQMSFKGVGELIEEINKAVDKIGKKEDVNKKIESATKKILNNEALCKHPIANKLINWGGVKRKEKKYVSSLKEIIQKLLSKRVERGEISFNDRRKLESTLEKYRMGVMGEIKNSILKGGDLRPIHMPGSVSRKEARNLYFNETYDRQALSRAATRVINSLCITENIGVYFLNPELMRRLHRRLSPYLKKLSEFKNILQVYGRVESDKLYLVLIKFLLWLYKSTLLEEVPLDEKEQLQTILELLKTTEGIIYFAPSGEKAKYATIPLPRLDIFFTKWLDVEERRKALDGIVRNLYHFMRQVIISARKMGEIKKAENDLKLVVTYYDMLCEQLLKSGFIDSGVLRRIIDLIVELSGSYNVSVSLFFIKSLTLM